MFTLTTIQKIGLARLACSCVLFFRNMRGLSSRVILTRGGLRWNLDLTEGIDFSIYLLGGFEPRTLKLYKKIVQPGDTVLDIGANIGSHTLPLARLVGENGRVLAFEPTSFAFDKLNANISLNKDIGDRIVVRQVMLVTDEHDHIDPEIYSSWPLFENGMELHEKHRGQLMDTTGAAAFTLDRVLQDMQVARVNFVKIDVDGHEYTVFAGGKHTLEENRPLILMELAPYLFEQKPDEFNRLIALFHDLDYIALEVNTWKELPLDTVLLKKMIPVGGSRNILLQPRENITKPVIPGE